MATSPDQVHGHQYVDFDEYIDIQLRKTGSTIKTTDVMTAVVGVLTLITLYLLLFVICDHWLVPGGIGPVARSVMLGVVGSIACVWMAIKVIVPWRRRVSGLYAASTIEKASPALKSSLINLVDISRSGHEVSPEIYQSIERRAALALTHVDVNETVDRRSLLRLSNALLAVVVLFCLYWIFSPKNPGTSLWRAMVPSSEVGVATRTEIFNVHPGDKDVLARSQLEVTADIRGELPQQTFLYFTTADRKFVDERVEMRIENEGTRKFRCVLTGDNGGGILQNMTYRIIAGDATTPEYKIRVIQPPAATIDSIRLDSPDYTHRESVTQTTGAIDALEGTRARLKAHANMPLRSASLQFFDDESATKRAEEFPIMVTDGTKLQVDWKLEIRSDGTYPHYYRIFCTSTEGESDPSPSLYNYSIRPDLPPEITLRDPKTDLDLPSNAVLPLLIEARDPDFALTYIDLIIEKDGSPVPLQNVYSGNDQQFKTTYRWQFKDYQFRPKDTITYWLEAKDNRQPSANVSRTPKLRIHITAPVSEEQVKKQLAMNEQRQKEEAKKAEAEQPPEGQQDEKTADNREGQQSKQPKKGQKAAKTQNPGEKPQGNSKPEDQPDSDNNNNKDQQPGKTDGDRDQTPQPKNDVADRNENQPEKLDPDNPTHDAKAIEDFDKLLNPRPGTRPNPLTNGLGGQNNADQNQNNPPKPDQSQPDQNKQDQNQSEQKKTEQNQSEQKKKSEQNGSEQNAGPGDQRQPGSSSDSPGKGPSGDKKQDQGSGRQNPSEGSQPENQKNGNQNSRNPKDQSRDENGSKGQSSTPQGKQDAPGSKPQGGKPEAGKAEGSKPSDMKNESGRSGAQPDAKNDQQPGGERGRQQKENKQGLSQGSRENKPEGDQQNNQGGDNSKTKKQPGENSGQEGQPGQQKSQGEHGKGQNSEEQKGQKADQSPSNSGKPSEKQDGTQDRKTPPKGQDGASDSGSDTKAQPNKNGDQSQNGNQNGSQPGDEKGKDGNNKNGTSQTESQKNGSQDNGSQENNSQNNDGNPANRKPGENGGQKPSENQSRSNESGKREPGNKADRKKGSAKESGDNSPERGENGQKEPGQKTGQASRKTDRDPNRQPNQGQTGNPNGEQQQKDKIENGDAASGRDTKSGKESRDDRRRNNPVDAKTPESNRRPLDEQPTSVRDQKNRTGTAGSETDPSRASQKEGTPQQGAGDEQGRKQQTGKTGDQGQPERGGDQKEGGAQSKPGGSQEHPGGNEESAGKAGQPKSGGSKDGQPQADQGRSGQGQQAQGKEGQKGAQGKGNEGASGSGEQGQGKQAGSQGSKPGAGLGEGNEGHNGGGFNKGNGSGAGGPLEDTTNQANLEYAKKATDLVLNKLENQLQRGKIDKKIEEEMGWNKEQVRRFVERMRKEAQAAQDPNSPASEARRLQFEETLKSLNLRSTARSRTRKDPSKNNDNEIGGSRSLPPPEYRDLYDAFTKSLAKPAPRPSDEKK